MIFFFKQKTAYEIYQCDWSSDVCSSDLDPFDLPVLDGPRLHPTLKDCRDGKFELLERVLRKWLAVMLAVNLLDRKSVV